MAQSNTTIKSLDGQFQEIKELSMSRLAMRQVRSGKIISYKCLKIGRICEQHMERNIFECLRKHVFCRRSFFREYSFPSLNLCTMFCLFWTQKTGIKKKKKNSNWSTVKIILICCKLVLLHPAVLFLKAWVWLELLCLKLKVRNCRIMFWLPRKVSDIISDEALCTNWPTMILWSECSILFRMFKYS